MKLCLICNFQTAGDQEICPRDGSSMVIIGDDPLLGVVVEGRYKIESVIGQGSAGTVYKAVQELIGREVAIKVLHDYLVSDQEFIKRFTQEAKASSRLSHPNIITIYDFGVIPKGGRPYIAMDLLKGTPLSDYIGERNHIPVEDAIPIFKQVSQALAEAHRQGVVHRDIKPENIVLVERSGQKLFPIVVDFGIARLVQEESDQARITRTGTVCGSPTYMSPEQCTSSKVDHRSDLYSLGIVIYETLTGEVPFLSDELVKVMAMHLSDPPTPLNQVRADLQFPEALEEVVTKTLAKNPKDRYQTMEELAQALDDAMREPDKSSVSIPTLKRPDMSPGPLAADEDLARHRASKEMIAPRAKPMDLATMALEELKTSGAFNEIPPSLAEKYAEHKANNPPVDTATTASNQSISHSNFQRGRVEKQSIGNQVMNINPKIIVGACSALILAAIVGFFSFGDISFLHAQAPWKASTTSDADTLFKQQKYEEALIIYKSVLKQQGKLAKPQQENFAKASVAVSQQYAGEKRYDDACALLKQVPPKTTQADKVKQLLARYTAQNKSSSQ